MAPTSPEWARSVPEPGAAVEAAVKAEQTPARRRLGHLLLADGLISPEDLAAAAAEQRRTGEQLSSVIARLGHVTEAQLVALLSRVYGIPAGDIPESIEPDLVNLIPRRMAMKYEMIAVRRTPDSLTLAVADPTNLPALDDISFMTALRVIPMVASPSAIRRAIEQSYQTSPNMLSEAEEASGFEIVGDDDIGSSVNLLDLKASTNQAPVVRLVNTILLEAIRRGASDIHLEPSESAFRIRFRIDGMLHEAQALPKRLEAATVSRIKIMASLDIAERRLPQDGRIKVRYEGRDIDFRVSVLPTIYGEGASVRVLEKGYLASQLNRLGFDDWSYEQFQKAIQKTHGMIVMTGPTGSGKTTTLYAAIQTIKSTAINIMAVEDPVEYNIEGVNQVSVNEEIGRSFATILRSFLRHDPDVILVGEIRDLETAQIAVRSALTGHLVLTTLHTNDCASSVARLVDMGAAAFLIASSLRLVVAQRLARRLCLVCREQYEVDEESLVPFGHAPIGASKLTLYRSRGCKACHSTGMKGRVGLFEVMPVTPEICELISRNAPTSEIRRVARHQGMKTLRQVGLLKMIDGVLALSEVLRVTAE